MNKKIIRLPIIAIIIIVIITIVGFSASFYNFKKTHKTLSENINALNISYGGMGNSFESFMSCKSEKCFNEELNKYNKNLDEFKNQIYTFFEITEKMGGVKTKGAIKNINISLKEMNDNCHSLYSNLVILRELSIQYEFLMGLGVTSEAKSLQDNQIKKVDIEIANTIERNKILHNKIQNEFKEI